MRSAARAWGERCALTVAVLLLVAAAASGARAGVWAQIACVNPNGSAATSEGWSGFTSGSPFGASGDAACAPGTPMTAALSDAVPAPVFSSAGLMYTPPPGSTLVGGTLGVHLSADGNGTGAAADAEIDEPAQTSADARKRCTAGSKSCAQSSATDYTGTFTLPRNVGGNLYVTASCNGTAGLSCDNGERSNAWALVQVSSAKLLLQNIASPDARRFSGTLIGRTVHGTGRLRLTAADPGGPGVYQIEVTIDGRTVSRRTPSRNGGACVPVGTDAATGALEFDAAQPCPTSVPATVRVATAKLPDGRHHLVVSVIDAAGNTTSTLRRTISTENPELTPRPAHGLSTRFAISWRWARSITELRTLSASRLPRSGTVAVSCTGPRCPSLPPARVPASGMAGLYRRLRGVRLHPGDALLITVAAPHQTTERIRLTIRAGAPPQARLLAAHR